MTGQQMLAEAVLASKDLLTRYLDGFDDDNCTRQATSLPNHVVWCLGHCALTMHRAAELIDGRSVPETDFTTDVSAGHERRYHTKSIAFGSSPTDKADCYPPLARAIEVYEAACDRLATCARAADEDALNRTVKWGASELSLWSLVLRVTFHNGMHGGQITDLRRALGFARVIQ